MAVRSATPDEDDEDEEEDDGFEVWDEDDGSALLPFGS